MARHLGEDLMVGPGGHIRVPRSESATLDGAIQLITNGQYREAIDLLRRLKNQVKEGYHRNPSESRVYSPLKIVGVFGTEVHEILYRHKNGGNYEHKFKGDNAQLIAIERQGKRDLLITSERGVPLWDEF
jgi:hypothetical protein